MSKELTQPELHALAKRVASLLGEGWSYVTREDGERDSFVDLAHRDGYGLHFGQVWNQKERISISGKYPRDRQGRMVLPSMLTGGGCHSITVMGTKTPEQIAKDIARRFLPEYLEQWRKCCEYVDRDRQCHAERQGIIDRLAAVSPKLRKPNPKYCQDQESLDYYCPQPYSSGDITPYGEGTVEMKLRGVPVEQAEAILRIVLGVD